jgi:iron complex transport system permease protein
MKSMSETTGVDAERAVVRAGAAGVGAARRWIAWRRGISVTLIAAAVPLSLVLATGIGPVPIPAGAIAAIILHHLLPFLRPRQTWSAGDDAIIWLVRFPRVVEGALVGAALAVAGALFQGLLRNPLADPFLLGISSGAALGATLAFAVLGPATLALGLDPTLVARYGLPAMGFVGALVAIACVYSLARVGQRTPVVTLILAGVAVSALLGAAQTLIITQDPDVGRKLGSIFAWLSGGIILADWPQIGVVALLIALGLCAALLLAPVLDTFALGEEGALHLGVRVEQMKLVVVAVAALLVAAAVALSGLVGFVGLFVPHVCRMMLGPRHRLLLPAAALAGSVFIVWADVLARTLISGGEVPLGVISALVGGPFFLWLLRRNGRDYQAAT